MTSEPPGQVKRGICKPTFITYLLQLEPVVPPFIMPQPLPADF